MSTDTIKQLTEHFVSASPTAPLIGPRLTTLATIDFCYADDLPAALRAWEQLGFAQLDPCGETAPPAIEDRNAAVTRAADIGASLVLCTAWPAPPQWLFLAPRSPAARAAGRHKPGVGSVTLERDGPPPRAAPYLASESCTAARMLLDRTDQLQATVERWEHAGFLKLGSVDLVLRNDDKGFLDMLVDTGYALGATLVAFQSTLAKRRCIRRLADGRIDMDAVRADAPLHLSRRGMSVMQLVLLAPTSVEARARAEASLPATLRRLAPAALRASTGVSPSG